MSLFRKKEFFTDEEKQTIIEAVKNAEHRTSGEVRVFVEGRCRYVNAIDRAIEIFGNLQMHKTELRNAVLVYVAIKDNIAEGICQCVKDIGEALSTHFPYDKDTDKNELPDDIVFGR